MSHYSDKPGSCRVDIFKESGKWYDTIEVDFSWVYNEPDIHRAFEKALYRYCMDTFKGMQAICLEPYHKNSHPISIIWDGGERLNAE